MKNNKICPGCGASNKTVADENDNIQNNINNNDINESEGNILGIISLTIYFAGPALISFISHLLPRTIRGYFSVLSGLCLLSGIVISIIGVIKYPTNKFLKIVILIIIGSIILSLIAFIVFVIWCYVTCLNIDTSGCS